MINPDADLDIDDDEDDTLDSLHAPPNRLAALTFFGRIRLAIADWLYDVAYWVSP